MSSNTTIVITGAAGALGSSLAHALSRTGYALALIDVPAAHAALTALSTSLPAPSHAEAFDANDADAWTRALTAIEAKLGPVHGAALIAGGWQGGEPVHNGGANAWRAMMDRNADTVWNALRALTPGMVARRAGSVVIVGSRNVERPWTGAGAAAYTASKAAAVGLAQAVASEVLEHSVRVNSVLPSTIDTPANRRAMPDADPTRWVNMDSLSGVIAFLLSDASRDISGAAIPVYGRA